MPPRHKTHPELVTVEACASFRKWEWGSIVLLGTLLVGLLTAVGWCLTAARGAERHTADIEAQIEIHEQVQEEDKLWLKESLKRIEDDVRFIRTHEYTKTERK